MTFSTNTPVQHAIADFLETRRGLAELAPFFQAKRDLFLELMQGIAVPAAAVPRQLLPADGLLGDHRRARRRLRDPPDEGTGVASIPTSPFLYTAAAPNVLRFCFAKKDETLRLAAERLAGCSAHPGGV